VDANWTRNSLSLAFLVRRIGGGAGGATFTLVAQTDPVRVAHNVAGHLLRRAVAWRRVIICGSPPRVDRLELSTSQQ
jgi:hypothetical protein